MSTQISTNHDSDGSSPENVWSPNKIVKEFLLQCDPTFRKLVEIREKGWLDPRGDEHFRQQRQRADYASKADAKKFYEMMKSIADELEAATHVFCQSCHGVENAKILDLCMAPGGYTSSALKYNPGAEAYGITLPPAQGGHEVFCKQSRVIYLDITMLAKEFGVAMETIPPTHPDHGKFLPERPYIEHKFNLVFCDGQVLRKHERAEYREHVEPSRLTHAQLILALQRVRPGGTLIILLHKLGTWETLELLYLFSQFSSIQVFKPKKKHAIRSSFYLVASNMQPDTGAASLAIQKWKNLWKQATFEDEKITAGEDYVREVLERFGGRFCVLARPVWEIQADALGKMPFVK